MVYTLCLIRFAMESTEKIDAHKQLLTENQNRIFAFIFSLLPDKEAAHDVLQETNVILCQKLEEFQEGTSFVAWAFRIAQFQVLAYVRDRGRDRHCFDVQLIADLAKAKLQKELASDDRQSALQSCIGELNEKHYRLIRARYWENGSVAQMAKTLNRSVGYVSQTLYRIRLQLIDCVQRRMNGNAK